MRIQSSIFIICSIYLISICRIRASAAEECSADTLSICLGAFNLNNIDIFHLDDDVPSWNESVDKLKQRCQAYNLFSSCMELITPSCNNSIQLGLQGLANAYHFLCTGDGITDYVTNQSCYIQPDVRDMIRSCNQTFNAKLLYNSVPLYCKSVDDYIGCLSDGITSSCGANAAKWQSDWIRNLRQPEMQLNKCPDWTDEDDSDSGWATALLVALSLVTTLMIVGILVLIVFIIRKRILRQRLLRDINGGGGPDSDLTPHPPPYSVVVETPGPDGQMHPHLVDSISSAPQEETSPPPHIQGTSIPFKVPILPPPYTERPDERAPPYYTTIVEASGQVNAGFLEEGTEKRDETRRVVRGETESKDEASDA